MGQEVAAYIISPKHQKSGPVPESHGLQGLRGQPLKHPLQRGVQRVVLVTQGLTAALQQPLVEAGFTQNLLVPLTVHQELEDVGHSQLQVQSMLEERGQEGGGGIKHVNESNMRDS